MTTLEKLTSLLEQQSQEIQALKTRLSHLEAQAGAAPKGANPTTRRQMLKKLAIGLVAGAVAATPALSGSPMTAQAKLIANPTAQVGAIVTLRGTSYSLGGLDSNQNYGLMASSDSPADFGGLISGQDMGVVGVSKNGYGMCGDSPNGVGVAAYSTSGTGLYAESANGVSIYCYTYNGRSIVADAGIGVPFRIVASAAPTSGNYQVGDMYVSTNGYLHIWNGSSWRTI